MRTLVGLMVLWVGVVLPIAMSAQERFRIMSYNVENLFDCQDDSLHQDEEFLPSALRRWNSFRFYQKVANIGKVIIAASAPDIPDLVGLCEVENDSCLYALVHRSPLREFHYKYVMTQSADVRGIDVALLYQPKTFRLLSAESLRIAPPSPHFSPTRDVLHVTGRIASRDTLDVYVVHAPSRRLGKKESTPYRRAVMERIRQSVDSIVRIRRQPNIVIMGDFNAPAHDPILTKALAVQPLQPPYSPDALYNLLAADTAGTYKYKGLWETIDHIVINGQMLRSSATFSTTSTSGQVLRFPFLLQRDERYGGTQPYRTYHGVRFIGGFSDHLPIVADLQLTLPQ